jgi:multidrug efflux system membrane fusion protein
MLQHVVVVPSGAVQRGPSGAYVYVVGEESKVAMRPITVASQDEAQAVVGQGVAPPEQVVTSGFSRLNDGDQVRVTAADRPAQGAPTAEAARPPPPAQAAEAAGAPARERPPEGDWGKRRRRSQGGPSQ